MIVLRRRRACFSVMSIFLPTSSGVTGEFPSTSHSQAAAMLPKIVAMTGFFPISIASVAVSEQSVACADGIDQPVDKAVDNEKTIKPFVA